MKNIVHLLAIVLVSAAAITSALWLSYSLGRASYSPEPSNNDNNINVNATYRLMNKIVVNIPTRFVYEISGGGYSVTTIEGLRVTAYNNLPAQSDNTPNIGASNRKVYEGAIALSRDVLADYKVNYGDVLCLLENNSCYVVEDTMNMRYDNNKKEGSGYRADIFMYSKASALKTNFTSNAVLLKQR